MNTGAGSASSGSEKSANSAASANVTARLALTVPLQTGSIFRPSAASDAATKSSSGSRLAALRVLLARLDVARVLARPRDVLALPLCRRLACFILAARSEVSPPLIPAPALAGAVIQRPQSVGPHLRGGERNEPFYIGYANCLRADAESGRADRAAGRIGRRGAPNSRRAARNFSDCLTNRRSSGICGCKAPAET